MVLPARPITQQMESLPRSREAFTLLEVVLVLAIMVVVAGLAYPSLDSMSGFYKVTGASDEVRAAWAQARAHAVNEGIPYRFSVVPHKGNYRLAPDMADYWAGQGSAPVPPDPANPPLVLEQALTKGVCFGTPNGGNEAGFEDSGDSVLSPGSVDPGSYASAATFLPDGSAREDVEVGLYLRDVKTMALKLRALTGRVTATRVDNRQP